MRALIVLSLLLTTPVLAAEPVRDCADCPPLVPIPGGVLSRPGIAPVEVAPFLIGRTEVTFQQWQACIAAGACRGGQDNHQWGEGARPVINVTADDAEAYVRWLRGVTGKPYRLPTEAEWEWAALAGAPAGQARWGAGKPPDGMVNCRHCGVLSEHGYGTVPAGSLPPNPWGAHELEGNVWEWTADCWAPRADAPATGRDCGARVTKGGAWYYGPSQSRPEVRVRQATSLWSYTVGFRVARDRD